MHQVRILYVEDYDLVLFTVKQLLELEGWRLDVCRDGAEALKKIEGGEFYDVIVMDAELPRVSGVDLLSRARQLMHRRRTPMIMFTANDCMAESLDAGADIFLKKPGGIRDLVQAIERLLDTKGVPLRKASYSL